MKSWPHTTLLICFALLISSCGQSGQAVKGKFVFNSIRPPTGYDALFILEGGKIRHLGYDLSDPDFSPDGKRIIVTSLKRNAFVVIGLDGKELEAIRIQDKVGVAKWAKDGTDVIYFTASKDDMDRFTLRKYDLKSKTQSEICDMGQGLWILNFAFSPGDDFIIQRVSGSSDRREDSGLYLFDLKKGTAKLLSRYGLGTMWFPDGYRVAYFAYRDETGKMIGRGGALFEMDLRSGEKKLLRYWSSFPAVGNGFKLSSDGKYFITTAPAEPAGTEIVLLPVNDPKKVIQVTRSFKIPNSICTIDSKPDWYQGN